MSNMWGFHGLCGTPVTERFSDKFPGFPICGFILQGRPKRVAGAGPGYFFLLFASFPGIIISILIILALFIFGCQTKNLVEELKNNYGPETKAVVFNKNEVLNTL